MDYTSIPGKVDGEVCIPGSKSHTIRAVLIASMAEGTSRIRNPLYSADTRSCIAACRAFGAQIHESPDCITVSGTGGAPHEPSEVIDVGNSGTTLYLAVSMAALIDGSTVFTGDNQILSRPVGPLLESLKDLGATIEYLESIGYPPFRITGPIHTGETSIVCETSQYLSSLLLALPLIHSDKKEYSRIHVPLLNERPYIQISLDWLAGQGIHLHGGDWSEWEVTSGQRYSAFDKAIPGDFSSASFFLCAAAMTGSKLRLTGLDMNDSQGDKAVVGILEEMGCSVWAEADSVSIAGPGHPDCPAARLKGGQFDLNAIPDALPILACCACFASEEVALVNVAQARLKETDRIAVMTAELTKMGADIEERPDGLLIRPSRLSGCYVHGHGDHRVVMSLAIAGLAAESGETTIDTAESAAVTFPNFFELLEGIRRQ